MNVLADVILLFGLTVAGVGVGACVYERNWGALVGVIISAALGFAFWFWLGGR